MKPSLKTEHSNLAGKTDSHRQNIRSILLLFSLVIICSFSQQANARTAAMFNVNASGGDHTAYSTRRDGVNGGNVDIRTSIVFDRTSTSSVDLTDSTTLSAGTYHFRQVLCPVLVIDGNVTINCDYVFAPQQVNGQNSPKLTVYAGAAYELKDNPQNPLQPDKVYRPHGGYPLWESAYTYINFEGPSGEPAEAGGDFKFWTTQCGDLLVCGGARGGIGTAGGRGGDGGSVILIAPGNSIGSNFYVEGGRGGDGGLYTSSGNFPKVPGTDGNGGTGGNGGRMWVVADSMTGAPCDGILRSWFILEGGRGGRAADGFTGQRSGQSGSNGGEGGNGGVVQFNVKKLSNGRFSYVDIHGGRGTSGGGGDDGDQTAGNGGHGGNEGIPGICQGVPVNKVFFSHGSGSLYRDGGDGGIRRHCWPRCQRV